MILRYFCQRCGYENELEEEEIIVCDDELLELEVECEDCALEHILTIQAESKAVGL